MKIVIAPQAFKGALSGPEAARAIARGVERACPAARFELVPVADGGDGTVEALVGATRGRSISSRVMGPLGRQTTARWGVLGDGETAVIEMAQASGIALVPTRQRDPLRATSFGTGQLIRQALERGYRRIIVGLGGSATNDGGAGMAQALGVRFLDSDGHELPPEGAALAQLAAIDVTGVHPALAQAQVVAATDVTNPLCGPQGASAIYGPQKGASPHTVSELDHALSVYADIVRRDLGLDVAQQPGAGAAGGMGAGLMAFASARLVSGVDLVLDTLNFDRHLSGADLVITGEGRIDGSSVFNKAPIGVARRARSHGVPVIALAGSLGQGYHDAYDHGIDAVVCIADGPMSLRQSRARTAELLEDAAHRAMRLIGAGQTTGSIGS